MKTGMAGQLVLAIAGVLMAGVVAGAQGPGGGRGVGPGFAEHQPPVERAFGLENAHGRWWNNPKLVEQLKLTEAQRKSMDEILLRHRETLIDLRASLEKAELTMQPLMSDDTPNEAKILAQIDKVAQARAELEKANARFLLALRSKLTPEQWKQLQANRANREERGQRGGWGRGEQRPGMQRPGGQFQPPPLAPPPLPPLQEEPAQAPGAGTGEE
jgi:Spy/CpxP family protein refolding chaperone